MNKEEIIKNLEELKAERLNDLAKLNAKHDALVEFIANINYIINEAKRDEDG